MMTRSSIALLFGTLLFAPLATASITINSYDFDLNQFDGAVVTYRTDGSVAFDGKNWDNHVGVNEYTPGELTAGTDPGDQITLQSTGAAGPDWFLLTYDGVGLEIGGSDRDTFVVYEITSSQTATPPDPEATSWRISFNGQAFVNASQGTATHLSYSSPIEDVYQVAFDLTNFGLSPGEFLKTVYFENIDSGGGTSDPDFIFVALEGVQAAVPELTSIATWSVLAMVVSSWTSRRRRV